MKNKLLALFLAMGIGLQSNALVDQNLNRVNVLANQIQGVNQPINFVEIDKKTYKNNLEQIRKMIGPQIKMCVVMKSDAYGHGINNLIDVAIQNNVDYIAAIDNAEFKIISGKVRVSSKNIHLLRIVPVTKPELMEAIINGYDIEEVVGSLENAKMLSDTAIELSKKFNKYVIINVHMYIETGMGRMGVRDIDDMKKIIAIPHLHLVGVMSHLANDYAEPPLDYNSTKAQLTIFESALTQLHLESGVIKHIANSGATAKFPWARLDMVRVGSLTYGEDLDDRQDPDHVFKPVMKAFKSNVSIIERNIPPQSPINYDSLQYTRSDKLSTTATLRTGYNYGFPQYAFKSGTDVLIRGQRFRVIGKSSMNMVVVDITDEDPKNRVSLGDEAVIVGSQGDKQITWDEFAKRNNLGITETVLKIGNQNLRKVY